MALYGLGIKLFEFIVGNSFFVLLIIKILISSKKLEFFNLIGLFYLKDIFKSKKMFIYF